MIMKARLPILIRIPREILASWMRHRRTLEFARRVHCPALILQGGMDLHVPMRSAERIAAAMRSNGNSDVTVRIFPGVSHPMLPDPIGLSSGWVLLPAFLTSSPVLDLLAHWVAEKLRTASLR
ncbi:MAG: hypothetical protein DMG83_13170 [Acidobacteria bacterium]|nr:MAG: hypothetical protein DMG83_13170 [Acidobacteriota bacterium]